jgi:hypothetical protein
MAGIGTLRRIRRIHLLLPRFRNKAEQLNECFSQIGNNALPAEQRLGTQWLRRPQIRGCPFPPRVPSPLIRSKLNQCPSRRFWW